MIYYSTAKGRLANGTSVCSTNPALAYFSARPYFQSRSFPQKFAWHTSASNCQSDLELHFSPATRRRITSIRMPTRLTKTRKQYAYTPTAFSCHALP